MALQEWHPLVWEDLKRTAHHDIATVVWEDVSDKAMLTLQAAGLGQAAGALHALPLVDFLAGYVRAALQWELPRGRHADDHHLHPATPPVRPGSRTCASQFSVLQLVYCSLTCARHSGIL